MSAGAVLGAFGPDSVQSLEILAKAFISTIKAFATPLLFFAVLESIHGADIDRDSIVAMLKVSGTNLVVALTLAIGVAFIFQPGRYLPLQLTEHSAKAVDQSWLESISAMFPKDLLSPFIGHSVPALIALAILFGLAARRLPKPLVEQKEVSKVLQAATALFTILLTWLVRAIPLAVFCAVAAAVSRYGFDKLQGLLAYVLAAIGGMLLHVLICYHSWIRLYAKMPLRRFWKAARIPVLNAFGVNSSLATLPLTLRAAEDLGISKKAARLSACIGTNLNNDGILLYEAFAAIFVAQAYGIHLSVFDAIQIALISIAATFGVAGIPEAGVIALSLVLYSAGLPVEVLPLLLSVDWIVARCRSATNVVADLTVAIAIDPTLNRQNPARSTSRSGFRPSRAS